MLRSQDRLGAGRLDPGEGIPHVIRPAAQQQPGSHGGGAAGVAQGAIDQHGAVGAQGFDGRRGSGEVGGLGRDEVQPGQADAPRRAAGGRELGVDMLASCTTVGGTVPVPGMRVFPALVGPSVRVPSTPLSLWCWLRGDDPGALLTRGREIERLLAPSFVADAAVGSFRYGKGPNGHGLDPVSYTHLTLPTNREV